MRAVWTGTLTFGLLAIPVKLHPASQERGGLRFRYLHKKDLAPVENVRICREDGREVSFGEVVRGYRSGKGKYVVVSDEDFRRANVRRTRSIELTDFVEAGEIDPQYFEKPYFLEPEEGAEQAYVVLREALRRSGKTGIARFVLRGKEHIAALRAEGSVLVLLQMRFASELRGSEDVRIPERKVAEGEVAMAVALIEALSGPFDPSAFRDTYTEELKRIIEDKATGAGPARSGRKTAPRPNVHDLVRLLRESLAEASRRSPGMLRRTGRKEASGRAQPKRRSIHQP
ncbi:MAG: Ku protein [Candidatus Peribacteraceae bacterium]|nr:Ku protein [Candidatus Peribacteraceae bacterium]